jgi:hypothetical protein
MNTRTTPALRREKYDGSGKLKTSDMKQASHVLIRSKQKKRYLKKSSIDIHVIAGCETMTSPMLLMDRLTTPRRDETENLVIRYRKFNISSLVKEAVKAAGKDAQVCMFLFRCLPEVSNDKMQPTKANIIRFEDTEMQGRPIQ